jgi:hypothetical protein
MECWLELLSVEDGRVRFAGHNIFNATGEILVVPSELRFRGQEELTTSLTAAGFTVKHMFGDWQRGPVASTSRIIVIIAQRPEA